MSNYMSATCGMHHTSVHCEKILSLLHGSSAEWRVVRDVVGRLWVENICSVERQDWRRFTQWGQFVTVEAALIAIRLVELANVAPTESSIKAAQGAMIEMCRQNIGYAYV